MKPKPETDETDEEDDMEGHDTKEINRDAGKRICIIFLNFPEESFTYREVLDRTKYPKGTVKARIKRLLDKKIIRRYKNVQGGVFHYKLNDRKLAMEFIEGKKKGTDTPTLPKRHYLADVIPQSPHHAIQQVKLTEDEWKRTEHLYTQPSSDKDRGKQRVLSKKAFKIVVSPNTLNGAFYILEDDWRGELKQIYPELCEQLDKKQSLAHFGVSFDADMWANFRLSREDIRLAFATSHYWRELDVEGREVAVNSFLQNILKDGFDKTTYEAMVNKILEQILLNQEGNDERMYQVIQVLHKIDESIDRQIKSNEQVADILGRLVNGGDSDKDKKKNEEVPIKELSRDDLIMFG